MSTKLFLPLFFALLLAVGLGLFASMSPHWSSGAILALAVLAHVPAFLPVSTHGRLAPFSQKLLNTYPEIPVPIAITAAWVMAFAVQMPNGSYVIFSMACVILISMAYAAVRTALWGAQKLQDKSCQLAAISPPKMVDLSARYIFALRTATALASLAALGNFLLQNPLPPVAFGLLLAVAVMLIFILAVTWHLQTQAADLTSHTVADVMARQLKARPARIAVYHTGTAQRQMAVTSDLINTLTEQDIPFVLIVREKAALAKLPTSNARHVWLAPTLATLTDCAHPSLTTVLYPQDAPKNSHFTRFPHRRHVVFTAQSDLAGYDVLPKSVALYDTIVAPSETKANQWRDAASPDMARRVTCLSSQYAPASRYPGAHPVLGLFVGTAPQDPAAATDLTTHILALAKAVYCHPNVTLKIWFAPATSTGHDAHLRQLHRTLQVALCEMQTPNTAPLPTPNAVSLHTAPLASACYLADVLLAAHISDLGVLLSTQKPVVWIDGARPPAGLVHMALNPLTDLVDIDSFLDRVLAPAYQPPMAQTHFRSLADLCAQPPLAPQTLLQERAS